MLKLPLRLINELMYSWRNFVVTNIEHKGIFICVHLCSKRYSKESLYLVDCLALTPVGCYDFYDRYITLQNFSVSHIGIEDNEIERIVIITNSALLTGSIIDGGSKTHDGKLSDLNLHYYTYIKKLIKDYFIMNTLYKNYLDIHDNIPQNSLDVTTHRVKLDSLLDGIQTFVKEMEGVISTSESNYPVAYAQRVLQAPPKNTKRITKVTKTKSNT
jgi:hypothetical protein